MGLMEGKTCLITGGAGSLGLASARLLLAEGARVALIDREAGALDEAAGRLAAGGADPGRVLTHAADITRPEEVRAAVEACVARFGPIDVLFSNAGTFGTVAPIESYPLETFEAVMAVHVTGAFLICQRVVPRMRDGGAIVITSSVAGTRGDPGVYGYITAKHAQVGLMRCLAKELAPRGIRVNTLHPGPVDNGFQADVESGLGGIIGRDATDFFNEQIPLGRHASPEEIARSVLYLASDLGSFTTGSMLMADGGMSA
ncbi:SDR family NAD(P)-dependent oxidoreductase [Acidimangrovimonas sediminis]|uniref:SDR family NAD(P)-dependent oxidoreductase n=1 Tax=Acidimangrovimonas sediminis TaxID=2056283 RepID=UPI000C7FD785|nr:SDR family oxidoreductase [Acidimangrovimonas sediminis]